MLCAITYASYIMGSSQVLRKMNATLFTAYAMLVSTILAIGPISTILQAWLFLDERVTGSQIIGAILVTAGVVWIGWKKDKA